MTIPVLINRDSTSHPFKHFLGERLLQTGFRVLWDHRAAWERAHSRNELIMLADLVHHDDDGVPQYLKLWTATADRIDPQERMTIGFGTRTWLPRDQRTLSLDLSSFWRTHKQLDVVQTVIDHMYDRSLTRTRTLEVSR